MKYLFPIQNLIYSFLKKSDNLSEIKKYIFIKKELIESHRRSCFLNKKLFINILNGRRRLIQNAGCSFFFFSMFTHTNNTIATQRASVSR